MARKHPNKPHIKDMDEYRKMYKESITQPDKFWGSMARDLLSWERDFQTVRSGSLEHGDVAWFLEGRLNASYNCIDRHAAKDPDRLAIIFEADEKEDGRSITYGQLLRDVSKLAWVLQQMGVRKGDTVAIYLPMIPEAVVAFLACARIGALHSVVFAGFSADSLRDRIIDAKSKVVITTDEGKRGGKTISTKKIVDDALGQCPDVSHCLVYRRTGTEVPWTEGRDFWWDEEMDKWPAYFAPVSMSAEDPLFLLYTSGSTGKPKGVMHTTGGYLLGAAATGKYVFDIHDGDRLFCGGDVGWITGHTYVVYTPLVLGVTTVVFESTPAYPDFGRYWDVCEKHAVTQFYVAPTALRLLKRAGDHHIPDGIPKLRVLGTVGEPIAAEVWKWYHSVVGRETAHIVDVRRHFSLAARLSADEDATDTDVLANGNGLARHHAPGRAHSDQAGVGVAALFRHRARHHRPGLGQGDGRDGRRGGAGVQAAVAVDGAHGVGGAPAVHGNIPDGVRRLLLHGRRGGARRRRLLLDPRACGRRGQRVGPPAVDGGD